jgi:hypothetical protein
VGGFLHRAARHCAETGADPDDFVHARLFDDMAPFHFQIEAAWHHSVWGVEALKTGVFAPPALVGPVPFADLQAMIGKAETALEAFTPDEVNGWAGKNLDLEIGPRRLAFTSETFILSHDLRSRWFAGAKGPRPRDHRRLGKRKWFSRVPYVSPSTNARSSGLEKTLI